MAKKSVIKTVSRNLRAIKKHSRKAAANISGKHTKAASKPTPKKNNPHVSNPPRKRKPEKQVPIAQPVAPERKYSKSKLDARSYSLRELPNVKGRTFHDLVNNIREHADELNQLIQPGEQWAFELGSDDSSWNKSYKIYDSIDLLVDELERYETAQQFGNKANKEGREWIEAIKIVKVGEPLEENDDEESHYHFTAEKHYQEKQKEIKERKMKQASIISEAAEYSVKKGSKKVSNKIDIIESLLNVAKSTDAAMEQLRNQNAAMEKQLKALTKAMQPKKATKKLPKKATKKATKKVSKQNASKSTKKPTKRMPTKSTKKAGAKKVSGKSQATQGTKAKAKKSVPKKGGKKAGKRK